MLRRPRCWSDRLLIEQRRVAVQRPRESLDLDMPPPREQNKLWHVLPRLVVIGLHIYFKVEGRNVPVMVISLCAQLLKSDAVTSPQDCCAVRGLCGSVFGLGFY